MKMGKNSITTQVFYAGFGALVTALCLCPVRVQAQGSIGNNAVYNTSGNLAGSDAYVDASVYDTGNGDVCFDILSSFPSSPSSTVPMVVIDARGITPQPNGCANSPFPTSGTVRSVILLPVGKIMIQAVWVLPERTRVIGEGADPTSAGTNGTILQWAGSTSSDYMVQFANSASSCPVFGIGIENLTLDGNNTIANGIENICAQERSYVDHVSLRNFEGTGLLVDTVGQGQNSGPYSNITFLGTGTSAVCANIYGSGPTRGIHNMKCVGGGGTSEVGIYLDASGNSLEDISLAGFADGILVGNNPSSSVYSARGNVLLNIVKAGSITNSVVHICGSLSTSGDCSGHGLVSDLSILQVYGNGAAHGTIEDDTISSGSTSSPTLVTDSQVAIYAIGESMGGGSSRFTTASQSARVPSWLVGSGQASGSCTGSPKNRAGTLYSDMSSGPNPDTLYVCDGSNWKVVD